MQSLRTLRNHCRQWPRNTRYQAGRYPLLGPDFHRLDRTSFAWRTHSITSSAPDILMIRRCTLEGRGRCSMSAFVRTHWPGLSRRSPRRTFNQCHRQVDAAGKDIAMLTRRTTLFASAAAGAWLAPRRADAPAPTASTVKTPVNFDVPRGACDCHVHVFDPARFPSFTGRIYTPPE